MNPVKSTTKKSKGLTAEEKAALRERLKEEKAEREGKARESDVLAKIAEMPESDRVMAERIHEIVKTTAPELSPKTWYGMPAYANKDGKVVYTETVPEVTSEPNYDKALEALKGAL